MRGFNLPIGPCRKWVIEWSDQEVMWKCRQIENYRLLVPEPGSPWWCQFYCCPSLSPGRILLGPRCASGARHSCMVLGMFVGQRGAEVRGHRKPRLGHRLNLPRQREGQLPRQRWCNEKPSYTTGECFKRLCKFMMCNSLSLNLVLCNSMVFSRAQNSFSEFQWPRENQCNISLNS